MKNFYETMEAMNRQWKCPEHGMRERATNAGACCEQAVAVTLAQFLFRSDGTVTRIGDPQPPLKLEK